MSGEYRALTALRKPSANRPGDMWLCRRLGIVRVFNAHKRGSRKGYRLNTFHLYHFGKPSLYSMACDWREGDPNASGFDPGEGGFDRWEYAGNIFDLLPFSSFVGNRWKP